MKIKKPNDFFLKTNLLESRYITDGVIWTVDETIFNKETKLFLVISLNTRAILGYIQGKDCRNEDLIIELYTKILNDYEFSTTPCFVHSDMEETYHSEKVQKFLSKQKIYISVTEGKKYQNQVSQGINNGIKGLVCEILLKKTNSKGYKEFHNSLPENLKKIYKKVHRCQDKEYRKYLFNSKYFKNQRQKVIEEAILQYNKRKFAKGITRQEAQYYDSFVKGRTIDNTRLLKSGDLLANMIKNDNQTAIKKVQEEINLILTSNFNSEEKLARILSIVVQRQDSTDNLVKQGIIGLSMQLSEENQALKEEIEKNRKETEKIVKRLEEILKQQALIEERKKRRRNRKRLPEKDPMTEEFYQFLIEKSIKNHGDTYQGVRLRLALALLTVTGIRISELLPIRVKKVQNLFENSWIAIDRMKRGPASHKAFLSYKGKKILKERVQDFEMIMHFKKDDSYIFTPQYNETPLSY